MRKVYVAGGVLAAGVVLTAALLLVDFFGLLEPDFARWKAEVPPSFLEPQDEPIGVDDLADLVEDPDERLAALLEEGKPAYTAREAEAWADEIIPILERVCARAFARRPVIRLADRAELADTIARGLYARYAASAPGLAGPFLERQVRMEAAFESATYLGMYDPAEQVLYLAPTNVRAIMKSKEVDESHFEPLVKLIVAHELAHALQDQHVDTASLPAAALVGDGAQAYRSVVEGHAVFAADLVGHELGIDETSVEAARMMSAGSVTVDDPDFNRLSHAAAVRYEEIYLGGRDFIAHHHRAGGMDRVWQILAAPPVSSSMITDPDRYATTRAGSRRFYKALKGIEKAFGEDWYFTFQGAMTALDLHERYGALDNERRDRLVAGIEHARVIRVADRWSDRAAGLWMTVLRGREDLEPYDEALEAISALMTGWSTTDEVGALIGVTADRAWRHVHVFEDETLHSRYLHAHARRGVVLVDLECSDPELDDDTVARVMSTIFSRLDPALIERSAE